MSCTLTRAARRATLLLLLLGTALAAPAAEDPEATRAEAALARGDDALAAGQLEAAMLSFADAAAFYASQGKTGPRVDALVRLATAQQAAGHYREAARGLEQALALAEGLGEAGRAAAVLAALGDVHLAIGPSARARGYLERALGLAREAGDLGLAAGILNNLGNERAFANDFGPARELYAESAALAQQASRPALQARALANGARAALGQGESARAGELAGEAAALARELPSSSTKAGLLVNTGRTVADASRGGAARKRAHAYLREALAVASEIDDPRLSSYALGHLSELYEREGRGEEALGLARRAIFEAQQANAPESLYRWHRQAGRILAARGDAQAATQEYTRAVEILQELRHEMAAAYAGGGRSFRETIGPIYFELVDLLLRTAVETGDPAEEQRLLLAARDTVERLKAAELRDYFQDDCVDALQEKRRGVEEVSASAVVVYPIVLPDRLELLLSHPDGGIRRYSTPVGVEELTREIHGFRRLLEKRITRQYLPHAQRLHSWLIDPFAGDLAKLAVDTLVFVPDGPLRTVPMAALHDGERYLGERYALAVTPGVELTDPRPLDRKGLSVLLSGLSHSVGGYPELAHVPGELASVRELHGGEVLLDEGFQLEVMKESLAEKEFGIVHIATHGEFQGDVAESYLLAYDGRLTMDRLEEYVGLFRFRDRPLELLTLSACDTAAGDDRAALGLSGVAIKAGARSAIGTLWPVNDTASALLIIEFYRQLRDPSVSRAVALQRAQAHLRADLRYWHPGYWSPFLLISSWL
jgi:CHAT domain-containing protein